MRVQLVRVPRPAQRPEDGCAVPAAGAEGHGSWYLSLELPPALDGSRRRIRRGGFPALNAAIRAGHLTANAAARAELPPARRPKAIVWTTERVSEWQRTGVRPPVAVWTPAQTAAFLNSIRQHRLYAAYHLIALRGLRRGEACGLRWCDIDLDSGTAFISWQLQQYDGHVVLCPPKTARSERVIALDRTTIAALRDHRSRQLAERAVAGKDYLDSGYVFTRPNGDPMAPDWLSRYFRQLNEASGLPPIRLHDLRHGAASLALAAGADLKVVQDMLGHSSVVLTADTYTSVLPEVARKAAEDIASLIIAAGCLIPGTQQGRRPAWRKLRHDVHTLMTAGISRAHPAWQIAAPCRPPTAQTALPAARRPARRCGKTHSPPCGHTLVNLRPYRHTSVGVRTGKTPGQSGCAARDSNPEPAD
jgi:integrase